MYWSYPWIIVYMLLYDFKRSLSLQENYSPRFEVILITMMGARNNFLFITVLCSVFINSIHGSPVSLYVYTKFCLNFFYFWNILLFIIKKFCTILKLCLHTKILSPSFRLDWHLEIFEISKYFFCSSVAKFFTILKLYLHTTIWSALV